MLNVGWFSTGRDEAARQLLQAVRARINAGHINGKISFVSGNREPTQTKESDLFFALPRSYNIPLICLSRKSLKTVRKEEWRTEYDQEVNVRIAPLACDICLLAGYMLIVSQVPSQEHDMTSLHPAPPGGPLGSWQAVMWALIDTKPDTAGAIMHLVTPESDRGPVVSYCLFSIKGETFAQYWQKGDTNALLRLIRRHELAREFSLITLTLQSLSRGEISIRGG